MTKYILHGGETKVPNESNNQFFQEVLKDLPERPKVLLCFFAKDEPWDERIRYIEDCFLNTGAKKKINFEVADKKPKKLIEQIKNSDAIYIHGGRSRNLDEILCAIKNQLPVLFQGKTVAGSSAGAHILSKYNYSFNLNEIHSGYGLVNVKVLTHYNGKRFDIDYKKSLEELKNYKENLPLYTIKETEFVVIRTNN